MNRGHKQISKRLIDSGAKIDAFECYHNNTALHIACINGELEIVQMLANQETYETLCLKQNKENQTPFDISEEKVMNFQLE